MQDVILKGPQREVKEEHSGKFSQGFSMEGKLKRRLGT